MFEVVLPFFRLKFSFYQISFIKVRTRHSFASASYTSAILESFKHPSPVKRNLNFHRIQVFHDFVGMMRASALREKRVDVFHRTHFYMHNSKMIREHEIISSCGYATIAAGSKVLKIFVINLNSYQRIEDARWIQNQAIECHPWNTTIPPAIQDRRETS